MDLDTLHTNILETEELMYKYIMNFIWCFNPL